MTSGDTPYMPLSSSLSPTKHKQSLPPSYIVHNPREAYWRVMISNPRSVFCNSKTFVSSPYRSAIGDAGHLERANAWSHLFASAAFCVYAIVRVITLRNGSGRWSHKVQAVSVLTTATMFAVSVVFHVYSAVPRVAAVVRMLDHSAIYLAICVGLLVDVGVATKDFSIAVPQAVVDPITAAMCITVYFTTKTCIVARKETENCQFGGHVTFSLGLFRILHTDLEHDGLRTAGVGALVASWVLLAPAVTNSLPLSATTAWIVSAALATALLMMGILIDNTHVSEWLLVRVHTHRRSWLRGLACYAPYWGCVMTSHAWWHVFAFCSTALVAGAREYAVASLVR